MGKFTLGINSKFTADWHGRITYVPFFPSHQAPCPRSHSGPESTSTSSAITCNRPACAPVRMIDSKPGITGFKMMRVCRQESPCFGMVLAQVVLRFRQHSVKSRLKSRQASPKKWAALTRSWHRGESVLTAALENNIRRRIWTQDLRILACEVVP